MAVNKVILKENGKQRTLIDLTSDTVTESDVVEGIVFHGADGERKTGTLKLDYEHVECIEAGKQAAYDAFWDDYQENGNKKSYTYVFAGSGWNTETFRPKYSVSLSGAAASIGMFRYFNRISASDADDLLDFTPFNAMFDFGGCTRMDSTFQDARIKNLYCDCSSATNLSSTFAAGNGGYLENLTIKVTNKVTTFSAPFGNQTLIKEIRFTEDSEIAATITFAPCARLTKASITNIVNTLSAAASGKTLTLSKTAVNAAFTTDEWTALKDTKQNWAISLA